MDKVHIILLDDQKVYFTSDLHFGHRNILRPTFANRPWKDEKEMGEALIENWNSVVTNEDYIFHLGDLFWFNDSRAIKKVLGRLNGKEIYLLPGNHDDMSSYHRVDDPRIKIISDIATVWVHNYYKESPFKQVELFLSHCPSLTWPHRVNGAYNLFGHVHSGPSVNQNNCDKDIPYWPGLQYDCGVDNNDYRPISLQDILQKLESQRVENITNISST